MQFHTPQPLQPYWNLAAAPLQTQALEQALAFGLFDLLQRPAGAAAVAQQLALNPAATALWLDLLWSMDLLVRQLPVDDAPPSYVSAPLARQQFADCAQAWRYRAEFLARFASQWPDLLRTGFDPHSAAAPKGTWAQAAREQIGQEQRAVTVPAVLRMLDALPPLPAQGHLLDLGGGPGHVGIALAQRMPGWRGVLCDQPEAAEVAQENINAAGLSARLSALGCDLNTDTFGGDYDLIWCSAVLHFMREPRALMQRAAAALRPGGLMLMVHAELPDDPALAAAVLPFYGAVALRGNYLPRTGEIGRMMTDGGLVRVQSLGRIDFPMAPVWLYVGWRR